MDYIIGQSGKAGAGSAGGRDAAPAARGGAAPGPDVDIIVDGDQRTFMADVIEESRRVPVLVDFWATWCGPCKTLTPALEKVTRAAGGRIKLVKIDVDANQALVAQLSQLGLPLQSVPTVAAFWQGQILDMFQGAQPESEIKRFVRVSAEGGRRRHAVRRPARRGPGGARGAPARGRRRPVLPPCWSRSRTARDGWGGLIRSLLALGDEDGARATLEQVPPTIADHAEIAGARAALTLAEEGRQVADGLDGVRARLAADADDHAARYELATALNALGQRAEAADALLEILRRDRSWNEGAARLQLIRFFEAWGATDPATLPARPQDVGAAVQLNRPQAGRRGET